VENVVLVDVIVALQIDGEGFSLESEVKCAEIKSNQTGTCYGCLARSAASDVSATNVCFPSFPSFGWARVRVRIRVRGRVRVRVRVRV
jgi:hypothetical protein